MSTCLVLVALGLPVAPAAEGTLGDKVTAFCKSNLGKQVGGGECAHLASEALKASGGEPRGKDDPNDGDYVWGKLLVTLDATGKGLKVTGKVGDLKPGDILQFRDVKFQGRQGRGTYSMTFPHHTAVVAAVQPGGVVKVYQQNFNGKREVGEATLATNDIKEGWIRAYRPVAK